MTEQAGTIVVGVDGSPASKDALRWAAAQAERTGAPLRAVSAWRWPTSYGYAGDYSDIDFAAEAGKVLEAAIGETLGETPSVPVATAVVEGHPAEVLLEASRDADLLVVGSRGHGAFAGMLLGSVSQHCVQHASCSVVVVRPAS